MAATNDDNNTQIYMQLNIYPRRQYIYTGNSIQLPIPMSRVICV